MKKWFEWFEEIMAFLAPVFIVVFVVLILLIIALKIDTKITKDQIDYVHFEQVAGDVYVDTTTNVLYYKSCYALSPLYNADGTLKLYTENIK